uniref:Uncharacterized protein n=1 Tax=Schizaphis graminum TaxID=13262 RepID=A0A2S2P6P3_SCHGA
MCTAVHRLPLRHVSSRLAYYDNDEIIRCFIVVVLLTAAAYRWFVGFDFSNFYCHDDVLNEIGKRLRTKEARVHHRLATVRTTIDIIILIYCAFDRPPWGTGRLIYRRRGVMLVSAVGEKKTFSIIPSYAQ